jgi:glutamyl-tRNA reductase
MAERLTRDLVNKLLHRPTVEVRNLTRDPEAQMDRILWVRRLFGLDRKGRGERR